MEINEIKTKLNAAFKALRKEGFLAHQNFLCCSSCAGTQLANTAEKLKDKGTEIKGIVFYHRQDAEVLRETGRGILRYRRGGNLMIRFGNVDTTKHGELGLPTTEVGAIVCKAFADQGLEFQWNGSESSCIQVVL